MSLSRYTDTDMIVNVSDLQFGGTVVKRKAELQSMNYSPKEKRVMIGVLIHLYSAVNPVETTTTDAAGVATTTVSYSYGDNLSAFPGFQPYYKQMVADMTSIVDANTGEVLADLSVTPDLTLLEAPAVLDDQGNTVTPAGPLFGRNYMYEFEFFKQLSANVPVIVDNLIIARIQTADAQGKL